MGAGGGGAGVEVGKVDADVEDVTVDGVWNWGERPTNIDFVPSTNLFPNRGSLFELVGGGTGADRCGDVG